MGEPDGIAQIIRHEKCNAVADVIRADIRGQYLPDDSLKDYPLP